MTHDEFVSRLGPVLAPENYDITPNPLPSPSPPSGSSSHPHTRKRSGSGHQMHGSPPGGLAQSPSTPPFDWMHFEGRAAQTTLANMTGLDGLARERGWRSRCVFSLQMSRTGVEAVSRLLSHVKLHIAECIIYSSSNMQMLYFSRKGWNPSVACVLTIYIIGNPMHKLFLHLQHRVHS